jgi:hypothetical protein
MPQLAQLAQREAHPQGWLTRELVARSPASSADVDTRISITFDPKAAPERLRDLDVAAAEVSHPQGTRILAGDLQAGVARPGHRPRARRHCVGRVRPGRSRDVDRVVAVHDHGEANWTAAGPVGAQEAWDSYRHSEGR